MNTFPGKSSDAPINTREPAVSWIHGRTLCPMWALSRSGIRSLRCPVRQTWENANLTLAQQYTGDTGSVTARRDGTNLWAKARLAFTLAALEGRSLPWTIPSTYNRGRGYAGSHGLPVSNFTSRYNHFRFPLVLSRKRRIELHRFASILAAGSQFPYRHQFFLSPNKCTLSRGCIAKISDGGDSISIRPKL